MGIDIFRLKFLMNKLRILGSLIWSTIGFVFYSNEILQAINIIIYRTAGYNLTLLESFTYQSIGGISEMTDVAYILSVTH